MILSGPRISKKLSTSIPKLSVCLYPISMHRTHEFHVIHVHLLELRPEPAYLTNRAASYIAIKRFRPALADCQQASIIQSASPQPKTLIRLARCQLALGSPTPALSTLRSALALDPKNASGLQLQRQVSELEGHLQNFNSAKKRRDWGMARLALDKCLQGIEGEGGEIPTEWRLWRVELELARGNWEAANIAAKFGSLDISFLFIDFLSQ
jgi:DnaJ family protein C protein 7